MCVWKGGGGGTHMEKVDFERNDTTNFKREGGVRFEEEGVELL